MSGLVVDNKVSRCDIRIHSALEKIITSANDYQDTCIRSKLINHRIPRLNFTLHNQCMNATVKANATFKTDCLILIVNIRKER